MGWLRDGHRIRAEARRGDVPGLPLVLRTYGGIAALVVAVNLTGEVVVGLLLVALNAHATGHQRAVVLVVGAIYGVGAVAVGATSGFVLQGRTLRWLARERRPTVDEARRALRNPAQLAAITGALWIVGAGLMAVVAVIVHLGLSETIGLSGSLVLAGLTVAGVTYLVAARIGRPVTALALVDYPTRATAVPLSIRLLLVWLLVSGVPLLGIVLILSAPSGRTHIVGAGLFAAVIALVIGTATFWLYARSLGGPMHAMVDALARIGDGELSTSVEVDDVGEIGMLQRGVNDMVENLRERARIQDLFGRHVGPAVAAEAILSGVSLGGEARDVVALFVDITGSTRLTRNTAPDEFVAILNRFFGAVVDAVEANGGLVNKFEGDAALCVFGAPAELDDPATAALRAARQMRNTIAAIGEVEVGIGIAQGPVIAGQIGASSRLEYTVIGDAVNEAARLTELAKRVDGRILASENTVESSDAEERLNWSKGKLLRLRGRDAPTRTYRTSLPVGAPVG